MVGAVYGPELYAGKRPPASAVRVIFPPCLPPHVPRRTWGRYQPQPVPIWPLNFYNRAHPQPTEHEIPLESKWIWERPPISSGWSKPLWVAEGAWAIVCALCNCKAGKKKKWFQEQAPLQLLSDCGGCCCGWICQVRQIDFYRANWIREIEWAILLAPTLTKAAIPSGLSNGGTRWARWGFPYLPLPRHASFIAVCYMNPLHFNEGEMVLFHLEEVLSTSRHFNGFPFCSLD